MQRIKDFVTGKLTYTEFESLFLDDPGIWDIAQTLLSDDILNDDTHPFWSKTNRSRLECNNYSIKYACLSFGYDSIGKYIAHEMLGQLMLYKFPELTLQEPPEFSQDDLREKIGMEYLGGPEVDGMIDEILRSDCQGVSVSKFVSASKKKLRALFHLVPRKYPRWVQEPDWPMGKQSPMKYVDQQKTGDLVEYVFQDVDTEETKIVKQYY